MNISGAPCLILEKPQSFSIVRGLFEFIPDYGISLIGVRRTFQAPHRGLVSTYT